jgi:sodium-dependent dicarboxylate transporter 2/3/5
MPRVSIHLRDILPAVPRTPFTIAGFLIGIALAVLVLVNPPAGLSPGATGVLAMLLAMAAWWITEALPVHVTALLPLIALPVIAPLPGGPLANLKAAALPYIDPNIFLFLGGMCLAAAMERHGLHRRLALSILIRVGSERILLGFLLATSFISLWISNTATAVMMVPIAIAVIDEVERREGKKLALLAQSVMLSVAYGANIGGIGTKIGTAPNMQFAGFVQKRFGFDVGFLDFLVIGVPFVLMFLPIAYGVLSALTRGERPAGASDHVLRDEFAALGPASRPERLVAGLFLTACTLWVTSQPLGNALRSTGLITVKELDPWIAVIVALVLFALRLIGLADVKRLQWDALILLGGSFSLAAAVKASGLSAWAGDRLGALGLADPFAIMLAITVSTVFLSAFTSNTSTTQVMLEVVSTVTAKLARPVSYLAGVTIAASCDFMLPAGTPPNAIVYGTGRVRLPPMAAAGFL